MDKLTEKLNQLPKFNEDEKESNIGYIFGVSGPGRFILLLIINFEKSVL
jgi:hypothetical protein